MAIGISIESLLFVAFYAMAIAFAIKLWKGLDYIREACEVIIAEKGDRKDRAIALFKQGKSRKKIARILKVNLEDVNKWVDTHDTESNGRG